MTRQRRALTSLRGSRATASKRHELVELAERVGVPEAARTLGLNLRTAQRWAAAARTGSAPVASPVSAAVEAGAARLRSMAESVRSEALAAVLADLRDASRAAATRVMRGEVPPEELSKVVRALAESVKVVAEVDLAERVLLPPSIPESESEASEPAEPTAKPTEDDWH